MRLATNLYQHTAVSQEVLLPLAGVLRLDRKVLVSMMPQLVAG